MQNLRFIYVFLVDSLMYVHNVNNDLVDHVPIYKGQERTRPDKSPGTQDFEMAYEHIKNLYI